MKNLLRLEELAMFALGVAVYTQTGLGWGWFLPLLFAPDLGALGYLLNPRAGALTYNLTHHKGLAVLLYLAGSYFGHQYLLLAGIILFTHASLDRVLGYGLKYPDSFHNTHLGPIGQGARKQVQP